MTSASGLESQVDWRSAFMRSCRTPFNVFTTSQYSVVEVGSALKTCIVRLSQSKVVSGGTDGHVLLFDRTTKQKLKEFEGHAGHVRAIQFDDVALFSGAGDCTWRVSPCISDAIIKLTVCLGFIGTV